MSTKKRMDAKRKREILKAFSEAIGEENFSGSPSVGSAYRGVNYNVLVPWQRGPEIVVLPKKVEHVQETMKIANKYKLTVLPVGCGTITAFWDADVVIDMMGMKKIHKIDTRNSYVVVEAGVTFSQLLPLLKKEGYTIAHGSFPPSLSVMTNLGARRGFNINFAGRMGDQSLGLEIVVPDGTLLRTSIATYGTDYWSTLTADIPDIKGLFVPNNQKSPSLGIVTKAALRIWPILEARGLPIAGFDSFDKAMEYSLAVTKAGFADMSMVWSWALVGLMNSRLSKPEVEFEFLNHILDPNTDYSKPFRGLQYCYNWTQFRGYKEQVATNLDICRRVAKEVGGRVLEEDELEATIPKIWGVWKSCYVDFDFSATQMAQAQKSFPSGANDIWYYVGKVDDLIKLEKGYNSRLKEKYNWPVQGYYTRVFEYGVGGHLRYMPAVDFADEKHAEKIMRMRNEMHTWVLDNYPGIHTPGGYRTIWTHSEGMGHVVDKIREALDPNHIMYLPGEQRLEPEQEA